jgi:exodeoxyribonuclease V alpha subunit
VLVKTTLHQDTVIYVPSVFQMEKSVAKRLTRMAEKKLPPMRSSKYRQVLKHIGQTTTLSDEQLRAVHGTLQHKVTVLTGGPGTGKTTTLRAILDAAEAMHIDTLLAAPTGQAAKRMTQSTERPATTVHRMLGYNPAEQDFAYTPDRYLPTDMVVIDEASMLDLWLVHHLLRALSAETRLLLVGDVDQLPSVGAGNVLKDLIASGLAHVSNLTTIFRQDDDSAIVSHARAINSCTMPALDNRAADVFMFRCADDAVSDLVTDIVANRIPANFDYSPDDIQVLSAMYKGTGGVDEINARLQRRLTDSAWHVRLKGTRYTVGDRVIQTRNNYDDDVMNGQVGQVVFIDKTQQAVTIDFDGRRVVYPYKRMGMVKLAYAITTHRSQGSEYPVVVIPVTTSMTFGLQRNLLYTAVTRAKHLVVFVGSDDAVQAAIDNVSADQRWTALAYRLRHS